MANMRHSKPAQPAGRAKPAGAAKPRGAGKPVGPSLAADVIIELAGLGIVLVERRFEPAGWAIPGGFVDYGESIEDAAVREAKEETGLDVVLDEFFYAYSAADRDPRGHTVGAVFIGRAQGTPVAADDAKSVVVATPGKLPEPLAFDHAKILDDYFRYRDTGERPRPYTRLQT